MREKLGIITCVALAVFSSLATSSAYAYVGPGAGITAIGTFLAVVGSVILLIVGFLWYPLKRLFGKKASEEIVDANQSAESQSAEEPEEVSTNQ